ncbi:MAG: response regulator [Aquitalea sp.]|nr:response regulator [Aquitalea sp.]
MFFDDKTTVLIIEDSLTVRQGLRTMLSMAGITRTDAVASAAEGRARLKGRKFDVVLCDYNLGDGMDGQELLEALRKTGTLPLSTIWIMITGERKYERVVAAAEMAPDDYILKPFNSNLLLARMDSAYKRKIFLAPAHSYLERGNAGEAITTLQHLITTAPSPLNRIDANRLCAELLVTEGRQSEALHIYQELLENKVIPWAKMGVARIQADQGMQGESSELLREIIQDAPLYTDAYDLLAQNLIDEGQYLQAVAVLEKAVAISPRNFHRLKSCGTAALRSGDPEKAARYLQSAVEYGRNNNFFGPEILVDLLQAYSETGNTQPIDRLQAEISTCLGDRPEAQFTLMTCKSLTALAQCRSEDGLGWLRQAAQELLKPYVNFESAQRFLGALVRVPETLPDKEQLASWTRTITMRFAYSRHELSILLEIARKHPDCSNLIEQAYAELQEQSNKAVELTTEGRAAEAGRMLHEMAMRLYNERTGMNACAILLRVREQLSKKNQDCSEYDQMLHEILDWLPRDNERVQGLLNRLHAQNDGTVKN